MKKIFAQLMSIIMLLIASNAGAQVTTNGGSGLAATYPDLAAAITALNGVVISSPVTINLTTGNPQTAPAGGYAITQLGGTSINTITITGAGTGSTVTAAASPTLSSRTDAIFKIIGGDYITLQDFDLKENSANTTGGAVGVQQMTEFGIALFAASATDGAQNNIIQNNTITLSSATTYQNAIGIFSTSGSSSTNGVQAASSIAGTNSNNKFYSNTITGVAHGFYFISPAQTATVFESGNDIGGTSLATGNTITFGITNTAGDLGFTGYSGTTPAGIYFRNVLGNSARFNTINSTATLTLACGGIFSANGTAPTGITYTTTFSDNIITLTNVGTTAITGIDFGSGLSTGTIIGSSNNVTINQTATAAASGAITGIKANYASASNTCNTNTVVINQSETTGTLSSTTIGMTLAGTSASTINANSNNITINQTGSGTGTITGTVTALSVAGASSTNNVLTNTILVNQTTSVASGITNPIIGIVATSAASVSLNITTTNAITIKQAVTGAGTYTSGAVTYLSINAAHNAVNVTNNSFNTTGSAIRSTGAMDCILGGIATLTGLLTIKNNTANIDRVSASGAMGFYTQTPISANDPADTVSNNTITFSSLAGTTSATVINRLGGSGTGTKNVCNNTISVTGTNTGAVTGIVYGYSNTSATRGNSVTINSAGATVTGINANANAGGATLTGNILSLTSSATSATALTGLIAASPSSTPHTISTNTFNALNFSGILTTGGSVAAISCAGGTGTNINNNIITNMSVGASGSTGSTTMDGILVSSGISVNVFKNKIYGLTTQCSGVATIISGIRISGGNTTTYNNLIGDLTAAAATNTDAIRGISITSILSNTHNVYYNTVYLTGNGGTNFGSTGIFHAASAAATTATLNLRNNIIVNNTTPNGTGLAVAFRRSPGTAGTLANYASTSNNNLFFTGVLGGSANQLIYSDGVSSAQTLADYKNGVFTAGTVAPRDAASITENPTFRSTTSADPDYLHISTGGATQIDGAGTPISGITDDYDSQSRNAGTPDIGADEFTFSVVAVGVEYFRGSKAGTDNYLDWKVNCSSDPSVRLILERSEDGRNFRSIQDQNVTAARCAQGFNFTDASPLAGINYYRLKTISPDGAFRYSVIVALINKDKGFELISVAPNPVKANTVLSISSAKAGKMSIAVSDMTGKIVMTQNISVIAGNNPVTMNFATLGAGTYNIKVINADNEVKSTRFVKY